MGSPGKLAVVTGATTGIGRVIALELAKNGWDVAINGIAEDAQSKEVVESVEALGQRALFKICDVGVKQQVDDFFDAVAEKFGAVPDLLVNNAGVQTWSPLLELQEKDWDRVIQTVLKGCFLNLQRAARDMVAAGKPGAIVNIGSGCNKLAFPNLVDYTAAKGGVEMLTKVAAVELGVHSIRVNCVAPGGVLVERTQQEADDYASVWGAKTPLQRVGLPEDIANAVLYLAGTESSFVTGQTLGVDGGIFSKANWPY